MLSAIRLAAARQLRVCGALSASGASGLASRVATKPSPFATTGGFRFQLARRGFAEARARPAAKKPAAKKKAATKKPAKRATKVAAKKPAPKKRVKKVLSDEDKKKLEIRELKKLALFTEPTRLPDRSWLVYVAQHSKGPLAEGQDFGARTKQLSESYKALSEFELERLQTTASQNKLANDAAYTSWVESHKPEDVAEANRARKRLRRVFNATSKGVIKDERQPKRSASGFLLFVKSRWQSGDFSGRQPGDAAKSIASEWKALSEAERQPFLENAQVDAERYAREMKSVLGREVQHRPSP